jgi:hypothetical protein
MGGTQHAKKAGFAVECCPFAKNAPECAKPLTPFFGGGGSPKK